MKTFTLFIFIAALFTGSETMAATSNANMIFAWINNNHEIEIITDTPDNFQGILVTDSSNKVYNLESYRKTSDSIILKVTDNLDGQKNYLIRTANQQIYGYYTLDFIESNFNYQGPLGLKLDANKKSANAKIWSPSAESVSLVITSPDNEKIISTTPLTRKTQGLWETTISSPTSLEGLHYQYKIQAYGKTSMALDPYAKSMGSFNKDNASVGYGAIVLDPAQRAYQPLPNHKDDVSFIGMEVHVRDATISPNSPAKNPLKGTYLGFIDALDYYKDLGVTHLQILPLQSFYNIDESKKDYQDARTPTKDLNYNWGYDPHNYFTPSGWYSTDSRNPYARITELQKMNDEIHKRGLGIIQDVVYNHVYNGVMFEAAAPGLYLRRNRKGEVSTTTGAGSTLESRSVMVRKLIVDSLKYWQDTYHVDGFRFDLMGFLDKETMKAIRATLHPDSILYGEAWNFTDLPDGEATVKTDLPHELDLGAFNDVTRDSFAGRDQGKGYVQGNFDDRDKVRAGIVGSIKNHPQADLVNQDGYNSFAENPIESLNYLSIHDGFTLWDKINLSIGGDKQTRMQIAKNAYAMLLTSQGRVVLQQGCEAGRSKPLFSNDPYQDRAHTSSVAQAENGINYFHENSYSSSDATNRFDWDRARDFDELRNYVKGLIAIRKNLPALHLESTDEIRTGVSFIRDTWWGVMAYTVNNNILVAHNSEPTTQTIKLPQITNVNEWNVIADCSQAGLKAISSSSVQISQGSLTVAAKCSAIVIKKGQR